MCNIDIHFEQIQCHDAEFLNGLKKNYALNCEYDDDLAVIACTFQ